MDHFFLTIVVTIFAACLFMISLTLCNRGFQKKQRNSLVGLFLTVAVGNLLDLIIYLLTSKADVNLLNGVYALYYISFMVLPLYPIFLISIFCKKKEIKVTVLIYALIFIVFTIIFGTGYFFKVDETLIMEKEMLYPLYNVCVIIFFAYAFVLIANHVKSTIGRYFPFLVILMLIFLVIFSLEFAITYTKTLWLLVCMASITFYAFIVEIWFRLDGLTGLLNQISFLNDMYKIKKGMTLFILDVDTFKEINDEHGHLKGDIVLKQIALSLGELFAPYGHVYRLGGDEFAVIIKAGIDPENLREKFIDKCRELHNREELFTHLSIGYLTYRGIVSIPEFVSMVDTRMYINKILTKGTK